MSGACARSSPPRCSRPSGASATASTRRRREIAADLAGARAGAGDRAAHGGRRGGVARGGRGAGAPPPPAAGGRPGPAAHRLGRDAPAPRAAPRAWRGGAAERLLHPAWVETPGLTGRLGGRGVEAQLMSTDGVALKQFKLGIVKAAPALVTPARGAAMQAPAPKRRLSGEYTATTVLTP